MAELVAILIKDKPFKIDYLQIDIHKANYANSKSILWEISFENVLFLFCVANVTILLYQNIQYASSKDLNLDNPKCVLSS